MIRRRRALVRSEPAEQYAPRVSKRSPSAAICAVVMAAGVVFGLPGIAAAAPSGSTMQQDPSGDRLVHLDLATGETTAAGKALTGISGVQDLALGDGGVLYGVSVTKDLLVSIDPSDGSLKGSVPLGVDVTAAGITFTSDGTLWMTATVANSGVKLFTVDPATGQTTNIGLLGTPGAPDISGLVTTCDDEILGIAGGNDVVRIGTDPPTVTPFFPVFSSGPRSLGLDPATEIVWGLQSSGSSDPGELWHVDPDTGALTDTGTKTGSGTLLGLTIDQLPCTDTPPPAAPPEPLLLAPNFTG
jgi:hypothetical protein